MKNNKDTQNIILRVSCQRRIRKDGVEQMIERSVEYSIVPEIVQQGELEKLVLSEEVAAVLYEAERAQINALNKEVKHRVFSYQEGWSDAWIRKEGKSSGWLAEALKTLTPTQLRRFLLYALDGLTMTKIARLEGSNKSSVSRSVQSAKKKILFFYQRYMQQNGG